MKRFLSTDHLNEGQPKRKYASNVEEYTVSDDSDTNDTMANNNYVTRKDDVISLSSSNENSDYDDISEIVADANNNSSTYFNEIFFNLKNMFPNIREQVLLNYLKMNKLNKNSLENAINYFINYNQTGVLISSNETRPSTSSAATNVHEIEFIQNLFPNISIDLATDIINRVNALPNINLKDQTVKESYIVDYVFNNKLNEVQSTNGNDNNNRSLESDLEKVKSVIVDCDPEYLKDKLTKMESNTKRVEVLIAELIENKSYPKLKDYENRMKKQQELNKYIEDELDIEDFLKIYPDPVKTFYDISKEMSEAYKQHCRIELGNKFSLIADESIRCVLQKHNYHLTPAYRQLEDAVFGKEDSLKERVQTHLRTYLQRRHSDLQQLTPRELDYIPKIKFTKKYVSYKLHNGTKQPDPYPDNLDILFFKELQFIKNESRIRAYMIKKESSRKEKIEKGRQDNTLLECPCCCDNELLDEDMLMCSVGHKYCKSCIKRYAEISIGDCKYSFKCIDDNCNLEYTMNTLGQVLEPNMLSKVLINLQNEEIKKAGLDNLESCQYCTYAAIIENPDDKVFHCLNPDCLKETCRLCKEPNHLPLRCNEIEKSDEVKMRTWIENKVTEAMIRQCHKCGKRFYKVEGCNMMHCVCGAQMCYLCRQPVKDYKHFSETGCKQYSDIAELHQQEMEKAYKEAQEIYQKEHPDSVNLSLKHDPKKLLEELSKENKNKPNHNNVAAAAAAAVLAAAGVQRLNQPPLVANLLPQTNDYIQRAQILQQAQMQPLQRLNELRNQLN